MLPEPAGGESAQTVAGPSAPRPIAGTRHRRTESLRSLRSQGSDGSAGSALPTSLLQPPHSMFPPPPVAPPVGPLPSPEIPTAFVDLDFIIVRANGPFQQILGGGRELSGTILDDVTSSADNESFHNIRVRLKAERDAREPAYMPPIIPPGRRPLEGVFEHDVDRLSQVFADYTYMWSRRLPSGQMETFPARIRLAKADMYFVAITLPTFHPVSGPPQPSPRTVTAMLPPDSSPSQHRSSMQMSPGILQYSYAGPGSSRVPQQPMGEHFAIPRAFPTQMASPYSPFQARPGTQQYLPPVTGPRPSASEPPTLATPFVARPAARKTERPLQSFMQLPPILGSTPSFAGPSSGMSAATTAQHETQFDDDEDETGSPRKRRRVMGIDDVLQR